jgi:hypothetical protein
VVYQDSRFVGNRDGMGTIAVDHSDATFSNTIFAGNQAPAMIFQLEGVVANITNCTIVKNTSLADRGAMTAWFLHKPDSTLNILNSIVWDNDDADSSPECTDQIQCGQECACENCAVDSPCFTCGPHISVQVSHSNIQHPSCVWPGVGNINQDPQFVRNDTPRDCDGNGWGDPQCSAGPCAPGVTGCDDYGDFRLRPGSPAINAGDPNAADLPATDLDGNPRVAGCPDIGAYEYLGGGECCTDEDCGQTEICCANVCTANVDTDADTVADCLDLCPGEDDTIDADQNGTPDCAQFHAIPAASTWGMAVLALGLLILAKTRWRRRGATN